MTLVLPERDRLVAPVELIAMPPPSFISEELLAVSFPLDELEAPTVPSHVASARILADENPESGTAAARLAQAEQSIGEDEQAIAAACRALTLVEKQPDAAAATAAVQVLIGSGELDNARRGLDRLPAGPIRATFGALLAIHEEDLKAALGWLQEPDGFDALSMRGWVHLQLAEWDKAIHDFRGALRATDRPTPGVLVNLGYAYAALGSLPKAIRVTRQAQILNPDSHLIAFNLVAFQRALGDVEAAAGEIKRLQERHPDDIRIHFAEADLRHANGNVRGAQRVLRRARTSSLWASADSVERAELAANLAFVAWRAGDQSRDSALTNVLAELARTEYQSLEIAAMLPPLMVNVGDADRLAELLSALEEANPGEPLDFLRVHLAALRCDFEEATQLAAEWARRDLFNPLAAAQAIYLLADVKGDYDNAVEIGYSALRRVPSSNELRNNLAYTLALADRLDEAKAVLPEAREDSVYLTTTAALIDLLSGRIEEGFAGYRHAHELAMKVADEKLASLVILNRLLAVHRLAKRRRVEEMEIPPITLPDDWDHDPRFVLIKRVANRENVPWEERRGAGQ